MSSSAYPALAAGRRLPNVWDFVAIACVLGALMAIAPAVRGTLAPLSAPGATTVHLDPSLLPFYAVRTTLRMFAALIASIIFTFTYGTLAAKSRRASMILIPLLDILQSVPILGFLSFTVVFFVSLFPGRVLGVEFAAIFAIFTSQAWNMTFSFYQSLTTVPADLDEAARSFRLSAWQRFWRLEVPFAMPGLVWNTMLSMSGSWFFVVASEAITVGRHTWALPGIGSFVALALQKQDLAAIGWAILAMLVVILLYDQLLFRPLVAWSAKFRFETTAGAAPPEPWVLALLRRTLFLRLASRLIGTLLDTVGGLRLAPRRRNFRARRASSRLGDIAWIGFISLLVAAALWRIVVFVSTGLTLAAFGSTLIDGLISLARVLFSVFISAVIWVPIGVWMGLRPRLARLAQPAAQFLAAFPANLLFPLVVIVVVHFKIDPNIGLTPLMIIGTQWYVLFNVIAGAAAFPGDLKEAAANFQIGGLLWWRRVMLPGIMPYFITGAITATGNAWNTTIVAEVASWGKTTLVARGLGAYIAEATNEGNTAHIVLGVAVMSGFVIIVNRLFWRPLYDFARRRTTLG
ncbi:MAG TPA: ABC transporter permease subunit [Acetobacteraceae bacterium]|nr:ABC transporter permease subunit [Acetobacteraceae bacterium]